MDSGQKEQNKDKFLRLLVAPFVYLSEETFIVII